MKNYSLNDYQSKSFIKNFNLNNNKINVNYADNHIDTFDINKNNLDMIINRMESQVIDASSFVEKIKMVYESGKNITKMCKIGASFILILAVILNEYLLLISLLVIYKFYMTHYRNYKIAEEFLNDYNKNKLYLDNKELFNICNRLINFLKNEPFYQSLLNRLNITSNENIFNENYININTIDNLNYDELLRLYSNLYDFKISLNNYKKL